MGREEKKREEKRREEKRREEKRREEKRREENTLILARVHARRSGTFVSSELPNVFSTLARLSPLGFGHCARLT